MGAGLGSPLGEGWRDSDGVCRLSSGRLKVAPPFSFRLPYHGEPLVERRARGLELVYVTAGERATEGQAA